MAETNHLPMAYINGWAGTYFINIYSISTLYQFVK